MRNVLMQITLCAGVLALGGCATPSSTALPPIVFVHGNGDSAALWTTTLWRFESNGWPRERLHAIDLPYPQARDNDGVEQAGRGSARQQALHLAAEVDRVLKSTGAVRVVLVGNSRGGITIRNYVQNFGGQHKVSHAVLGGTPNHGVWADANERPGNEFNGAGPLLQGLNAPKGPAGDEVTSGLRWMTLRSDSQDKFAQPEGRWIGSPGKPTNVRFDGPALKGALDIVLPGRDHREVSYHAEAFAKTHEFITGQAPRTVALEPEARVVLDGLVSGVTAGVPTNLPLPGASVEVFAVDAGSGARLGPALHRKTVGEDGRWGPLITDAQTRLEIVLAVPGQATTHFYRSPFPRSSNLVHLRPDRLSEAERQARSLVSFTRPRGYFGVPRDRIIVDGLTPPPGVPAGVPGVAVSRLRLMVGVGRPVAAEFQSGAIAERIVGQAWPTADNRVVVLEMHE
jgi:triacylglycerol lipase